MKFLRAALILTLGCRASASLSAESAGEDRIPEIVGRVIGPLMQKDQIPGMAVGVILGGQERVYCRGLASKERGTPVTPDTLFELGSMSKTFAATLASEAQGEGRLRWEAPVSEYLPELKGTAFGKTPLLALATHTSGGLPLQVPDPIADEAGLLTYLARWQPRYAPASHRTYTNVGVGMLGLITARQLGMDYAAELDSRFLPALRLANTFIVVPPSRRDRYAQGYASDGTSCRLREGVVWAPTYGIKSSASDMLRYVEYHLGETTGDVRLDQAIRETHTGYFQDGPMTQDLVWEQYPMPVTLDSLLEGNSERVIEEATEVTALEPPLPPREGVWINKTGSTRGFGAYVAFVPSRRVGIVMLANKNYPIEERVRAAYAILSALMAQ